MKIGIYKNYSGGSTSGRRHLRSTNVVVFGLISRPFILAAVLDHNLSQYVDEDKELMEPNPIVIVCG
jgi:hypothetical protein